MPAKGMRRSWSNSDLSVEFYLLPLLPPVPDLPTIDPSEVMYDDQDDFGRTAD